MNKNSIDHAQNLANKATSDMPALIEKIRYRTKPLNLQACYDLLSGDHLAVALRDYFVHGDVLSLKQHLHVACKLNLAAIALDSYQRLETGTEIFYALLSDNPDMVNAMAQLEPPHFVSARANPLHLQFRVHMWQLVIQGDYEALEAKVERLAKNGRKADRALASENKDFFSLLMRGDRQGLEDLIRQHARIKSDDPLIEDFMCYQGTLEAKLCWLRGIPVQVDSPLLPMELMPIRPLVHYDDVYDFLQPGWQPPHQSIFGKVRRWYGERARYRKLLQVTIKGKE